MSRVDRRVRESLHEEERRSVESDGQQVSKWDPGRGKPGGGHSTALSTHTELESITNTRTKAEPDMRPDEQLRGQGDNVAAPAQAEGAGAS